MCACACAGYQKEIKYQHDDGSYSAFGQRDANQSGSMWYVVQVHMSLPSSSLIMMIIIMAFFFLKASIRRLKALSNTNITELTHIMSMEEYLEFVFDGRESSLTSWGDILY